MRVNRSTACDSFNVIKLKFYSALASHSFLCR